jgi:hypothetical protein
MRGEEIGTGRHTKKVLPNDDLQATSSIATKSEIENVQSSSLGDIHRRPCHAVTVSHTIHLRILYIIHAP